MTYNASESYSKALKAIQRLNQLSVDEQPVSFFTLLCYMIITSKLALWQRVFEKCLTRAMRGEQLRFAKMIM